MNVTLTTIEKDQVRERRKVFVTVKIALYTPLQYLLHTSVVVLSDNVLNGKLSVAGFIRSAVAVYYHTADSAVLSEI